MTGKVIVLPRGDRDAIKIGKLYRKAGATMIEAVQFAAACGEALIEKKDSLDHGEWLPWLEANADVLGFETRRTAARLMALAKMGRSTSHLDEPTALAISRQLWGNDNTRGTQGTGDNEWFTPAEYVELARQVLGVIDLDPASHAIAQRTVKAASYFTVAQNGLTREWRGRVWLNPPYAQPHISDFVAKLLGELEAGRTIEAIMLTHNYTDSEWFQKASLKSAAICFTAGRVRFVDPEGDLASPTQGQAFFYYGTDPQRFEEVFCSIGNCWRPSRAYSPLDAAVRP